MSFKRSHFPTLLKLTRLKIQSQLVHKPWWRRERFDRDVDDDGNMLALIATAHNCSINILLVSLLCAIHCIVAMSVARKSPSFPSFFPVLPPRALSLSRNATWESRHDFLWRGTSVTGAMFARTSLKYISPLDSGNDVCRRDLWNTNIPRALALINA